MVGTGREQVTVSVSVLPEAARSKSSLKETLFLSMASSDRASREGREAGSPSGPKGQGVSSVAEEEEGSGGAISEGRRRRGELGQRKNVARGASWRVSGVGLGWGGVGHQGGTS